MGVGVPGTLKGVALEGEGVEGGRAQGGGGGPKELAMQRGQRSQVLQPAQVQTSEKCILDPKRHWASH